MKALFLIMSGALAACSTTSDPAVAPPPSASSAPYQIGDVMAYNHGEGLIAGPAELNADGYWMTEYSFGPVGQSPVSADRIALIQRMLSGEKLSYSFTVPNCSGQICTTGSGRSVDWISDCPVRDFYAYQNMDSVRVEWECDGAKDGFAIVDFENGKVDHVRQFGPDRTIFVKDGI